MNIMKEVDYASNYPKNVHFYRVGGHDSKKIGIILNIKTNQNISINLNPHEEHLLKIESAEVIYPNIIIDKINNVLIDSNNGYTSTELINHNIYNYPLSLIKNNIVIKNNNQNLIIDEGAYIVVSKNYSSFLLGELPRLELYNKISDEFNLIVHGELDNFHLELLDAAGIKRNRIIKINSNINLQVDKLFHSTPTYLHHQVSTYGVSFLNDNFNFVSNINYEKNVYFSRSKLGPLSDRAIENENQLEAFLQDRDFVILHPENLSVNEQVKWFMNSKILVSPFGATWSNSVFRPQGKKQLMIATKFTPEFGRIFKIKGIDLNVLPVNGVKYRNGINFSQTHKFFLSNEDFILIDSYLAKNLKTH